MIVEVDKPLGYETELGPYGPCIFDGWCGETIAWGFRIVSRLGDDRFNALMGHGSVECVGGDWFLIVRKLTRSEAAGKLGDVTDEEFGPRGGWKSVTFGETKFISRQMKE